MWVLFSPFKQKQFNGNGIDLDDNGIDIKIAIVTASYTPNVAHDFFNDVSAYEVSGTNYTAGGNAVTSRTVTESGGTVTFDGADPATWSYNSGGFSNGRIAILYQDTGVESTSKLIAYNNMGSDKGNDGGDFSIELDSDGIFSLT